MAGLAAHHMKTVTATHRTNVVVQTWAIALCSTGGSGDRRSTGSCVCVCVCKCVDVCGCVWMLCNHVSVSVFTRTGKF
jgi:hypothetical protein